MSDTPRFIYVGKPYGHICDTQSVLRSDQMARVTPGGISLPASYTEGRFICESVHAEVAAWLLPLLNANADRIPVIQKPEAMIGYGKWHWERAEDLKAPTKSKPAGDRPMKRQLRTIALALLVVALLAALHWIV